MAKHRVIYTLNVTHFIMVPDTFWTVNNYFVHSQPPSKTNLSSKAQQHHSIISHKTAKQNSLNKYNSNSRHTSLTPASVDRISCLPEPTVELFGWRLHSQLALAEAVHHKTSCQVQQDMMSTTHLIR
jgi:hypothetical protein